MARPKKKDTLSIKQIEEAIKATGGMLHETAELLGCTQQNVCWRIGKSEHLQKIMQSYEKAFVKLAESQIIKGIREGNQSSSMFYLKCKGGYSEKQNIELSGKNEGPIKVTLSKAEFQKLTEEMLAEDDC